MKPAFRFAIIFGLIYVAVKFFVHHQNLQHDTQLDLYVMFFNLLLALLAIVLTLLKRKSTSPSTTFISDVKEGAKSAAIFAIIASSYTYIHYQFIDDTFLAQKIEERIRLAKNYDLSEVKDTNPLAESMNKEEFIAREKQLSDMLFSPFNTASITLFGFIILGFIYAIGTTLVIRKMQI